MANFTPSLIREIADDSGVYPAVNQIELHPRFQQAQTRRFNASNGIITEAWSPLENGRILSDPVIVSIAAKAGCSPAQAVLCWHRQSDVVVIPKAASDRHLSENLISSNYMLDDGDMARIAALDTSRSSFGIDPMLRQSDRGRF